MTPLTEHQLLLFWIQLFVLVGAARGLGVLMRRVRQPPVIGELAAGLLIGPSVLGQVLPGVHGWLFPADDPVQGGLLMSVAWIGVAFLLVLTGFETDLRLLSRLGRAAVLVSTGSLVVPLVLGVLLGAVLPALLIGEGGTRVTFALLMGVALAVSALPVIAKILMDMGLMRRNVGQVTIAAGMANDLVGWILLGVIAGVVAGGDFDLGRLALTLVAIAAFLAVALTVGQRLTDTALRRARRIGVGASFSVLVLVVLGAGAVTHVLGVEAVLGAFVAGIVLGRSRYHEREMRQATEVFVHSFFSPLFFATAGLLVDLTLLGDAEIALWAAVFVVVAAASKLVGSFAGGVLGGLPPRESLAIGAGLNARGAMQIIIGTVGLTLGVLNIGSYTIVMLAAIVTSMMAPPMLRRILAHTEAGAEESARLEREETLARSAIAGTNLALVPTRGGMNSVLAGRVVDLALHDDAAITVFTVHAQGDGEAERRGRAAADQLGSFLGSREHRHRDRTAADPVEAIVDEAGVGYGLVALGVTEEDAEDVTLSEALRAILSRCQSPMLLVKQGRGVDALAPSLPFRRVLVPAAGTREVQAAQEVGFTLAQRCDAAVDVVHVMNRPDRPGASGEVAVVRHGIWPSGPEPYSVATAAMLEQARTLADRFGREVDVHVRTGASVGQELGAAADEAGADVVVVGAQVRAHGDLPFLGHGVEYILEQATQTVVVVVFPVET